MGWGKDFFAYNGIASSWAADKKLRPQQPLRDIPQPQIAPETAATNL